MASLDEIFASNNLSESKKKAKMYFGRILINLRKTNHIKMYSLLDSVEDTDIIDNKLTISLSDKVAYDMINNANDISILDGILRGIQEGLKVELICTGKEPVDVFKLESRLKAEFGKLLTIKK
ncbi:MAG: hypothetical protein E7356_03775 [Clostridiales bacterium]|nr:hypothetical protein [Clostridiales bacterium]